MNDNSLVVCDECKSSSGHGVDKLVTSREQVATTPLGVALLTVLSVALHRNHKDTYFKLCGNCAVEVPCTCSTCWAVPKLFEGGTYSGVSTNRIRD